MAEIMPGMQPPGTTRGKPSGVAGWTFAVVHTSGPDPTSDTVQAWLGMQLEGDGGWRIHEDGKDWESFADFVDGRPLVVPDAAAFRAWWEHCEGRRGGVPPCLGLSELAALLAPGRIANLRAGLIPALLEGSAAASAPPATETQRAPLLPPQLRSAAAELVRSWLALEQSARAIAATGWEQARAILAQHDEGAAAALGLHLRFLRDAGEWGAGQGPMRTAITGCVEPLPAALEVTDLRDLLDGSEPRSATLGRDWNRQGSLPPSLPPDPPCDAQDLERLDEIFQEHLPGVVAAATGSDAASCYRESQHRVAREIANSMGQGELLLVHAPTGTGKTLSYLVPALLWARRHGRRVAVATYTRALQEQAMEREVPRALQALACSGMPPGFRVSSLKGRENYLCWRALRLALPAEEESAETWLAWTSLVMFAWMDGEGDLDRFPLRPPLALASGAPYRRAAGALQSDVRARTGCCSRNSDRETCAADLARRRAERSHLVITNHAFALARQEFFKHVVFDECEHLHDQAHNAWSHSLSTRAASALLNNLHRPENSNSRTTLDRIGRQILPGTPSFDAWQETLTHWTASRSALEALTREVEDFERWRERQRARRSEKEEHSFLREYAEGPAGTRLVTARLALSANGSALEAGLAGLLERLDSMPLRGRARLRRGLEVARADLVEMLATLEAWLPVADGLPAFRPQTFHDVERDENGRLSLVARVLLPNEYLGRHYYPGLAGGVFLSATTWLAGSFDAASGYLGLHRAAHPAQDEERGPCRVRHVRAPEVFDYSRVLVAVPRDVPAVVQEKDAFLVWTRSFLAWLGERTRGRLLVLFTNQKDVQRVGRELEGFFRAREIPLWYQGMEGIEKEELSDLFRSHRDSVLLGVDTFWYGADFPGETLEYLVIARLPYGVPDRYHHAQCAALGATEQRRSIYMPRALSKFRQGFGRLMRQTRDRGAVFLLDRRVLEPRHRAFLRELPLQSALESATAQDQAKQSEDRQGNGLARLVRGDASLCLRAVLEHMHLHRETRVRELGLAFDEESRPEVIEVPLEDLPF